MFNVPSSVAKIDAAPATFESVLEECAPCNPHHPYLVSHGLEDAYCQSYCGFEVIDGICTHGAIAVPLKLGDQSHVATVLIGIAEAPDRRFYVGVDCIPDGAFGRIGKASGGPILVTGNWASGQSLFLSKGCAVAVAFEAGNLPSVCAGLAESYPNRTRVLCLDPSYSANQIAMFKKIAAKHGMEIAFAEGIDEDDDAALTFNELHRRHGLGAVASLIDQSLGTPLELCAEDGSEQAATKSPYPIDGRRLIKKLESSLSDHLAISRLAMIAVSLWVLFTYTISIARVAPILLICSPVRRCGKTTLGHWLRFLVANPQSTSNITAASLFRIIEAEHPTLLIDEADTFIHKSEEMTGIINSGHTRSTAFVTRTAGAGVKRFSTWGAKALMMIGLPTETILDRSIMVPLARKLSDQVVKPLDIARPKELEVLQGQIIRWVEDNLGNIAAARLNLAKVGNDRASDNWEPLLAIARCIGDEYYALALEAATALSVSDELQMSLDEVLLQDIEQIFKSIADDKISTDDLLKKLCSDQEKAWSTFNHGRPMSPRDLNKRLSKFGIKSVSIRYRGKPLRGFKREQFEDVFARYVP